MTFWRRTLFLALLMIGSSAAVWADAGVPMLALLSAGNLVFLILTFQPA